MTQNKNGLVAGNGIVNGSNGNNGNNHKDISIWGVWFAVFVVLLIIFGVVAIATPPKGKIVVDGLTDDWNELLKTGEAKDFKNPVDDIYGAPYNMNKLMMYYDTARKILYFAVSFDESFGYAKDEPHTLHFLIDSDANDATGYFVKFGNQALGVDYWGECVIYNDKIQTVSIYPYGGKGTDWLWDHTLGGKGCKSDDGTFIELSYPINDFNDDSKVFVITKIGYTEYPSGVYAMGSQAALVYKYQYGNTYRIKIYYLTDKPEIAYISFKTTGATLMENGEEVKSNILMPSNEDKFRDGEVRNLTVSYDLSATVDIENVAANPNDIITVIGEKFVGYKGSGISIDGNFDDWSSVNKFKDSDKISYGNADIVEYAHVSAGTNTYLYVKVNGIAMGGAYIPMVYKPSTGGGAGNITETNPGEDYMKITLHLTDGSEKVVEIKGKYGEINSVTIDGTASKKVEAKRGGEEGNKIEVGVYDMDAAMLYYEIEIKGLWCGLGDYASIRIIKIPTRHAAITIDGDTSDWIGTAPTTDNTAAVSAGEFIWKDAANDYRTDNGNFYDLLEFRITSDSTYLYFLIVLNTTTGIGANGAPGILITIDTDLTQNNGNTYFAYNSDTQVNQSGYANWEYQIALELANSAVSSGTIIYGDGSEVWNGGSPLDLLDTSWNDVSTSSDEFVVNSTTNAIEGRILLSEIGSPSEINVELGIVRTNGAGDAWDVSGASDIMDAMTTIGPNTWDDVSDGYIDDYATISFSTTTGDVISVGGPIPEISYVQSILPILMVATVSFIVYWVRRFD